MGKKFVNLPSNYRSFLDSIKNILDHELIKNIANNDIGYEDINKLHFKIEEIAEDNSCNSYDINRMINYFEKKNSIIEILRKIASTRNKYIVYISQKSDLWEKNLLDLQSKILKVNQVNKSVEDIESVFIKILKRYKYDWDGLWSIIDISKNGRVKNVCLFDYNDNIELLEILLG